jgi:tetratricopeptide (TPR) repeat protein
MEKNKPEISGRIQKPEQLGLFLGREEELRWLRTAWELAAQGKPQFRVITAESGYGKTRLVQAFYTWLSTECDPGNYWPNTMLSEDRRLHVMPDLDEVESSGQIPWFWWGLRCDDPTDRKATSPISPFIQERERPSFTAYEKRLFAKENEQEAIKKVGFKAVKAGMGVVPFLDAVVNAFDAGKDAWDVFLVGKEHREYCRGAAVEVAEKEKIEDALNFFQSLLDPRKGVLDGRPVVLILDDAHWMDPISLEIVRELWRRAQSQNFPLLIVATHWQKEWNLAFAAAPPTSNGFSESIAGWIRQQKVESPTIATESADAIEFRELGKLPEVRQILLVAFPGLDQEQVDFICSEVDGNPQHIHEVIELLKRKPQWFPDKDPSKALNAGWRGYLTREQLDLQQLESERFDGAPDYLKELLGAASAQGNRFLQEFTIEVAGALGFDNVGKSDGDAGSHLLAADKPYALAEALDERSMEFRSVNLRKCAETYLQECCDSGEVATAITRVSNSWMTHGKLAKLPLDQQLMLLGVSLSSAKKAGDRASQTYFLTTALHRIWQTGLLFGAEDWISIWEQVAPQSEDLAPVNFWALQSAVILFQQVGRSDLARNLLDSMRSHPELQPEVETLDTLQAQGALALLDGDLAREAGESDLARAHLLTSLKTSERAVEEYGESPLNLHNVSVSLHRIGEFELSKGNLNNALGYLIRSLEISEAALNKHGESLENLANVFRALDHVGAAEFERGQTDSALGRFHRLLEVSELAVEKYGESPQSLALLSRALDRLGTQELAQGQTQAALGRFRRVLDISERALEEHGESPGTLSDLGASLDRVGRVELAEGRVKDALKRFTESLEVSERALQRYGESRQALLNLARSLNQVITAESLLGANTSTSEHHHRLLETSELVLERYGNSPENLNALILSLDQLGQYELSQGNIEAAFGRFHRMLQISEHALEEYGRSPDTLNNLAGSLERMARAELAQGAIEAALGRLGRSMEIGEQALETYGESPKTLTTLASSLGQLGMTELAGGQQDKAFERFQRLLEIGKLLLERYGQSPYNRGFVVRSLDQLGLIELDRNQPDAAYGYFRQLQDINERAFDEHGESPITLNDLGVSLYRIGHAELARGQTQAALEHFTRSLEIRELALERFGESLQTLVNLYASSENVGGLELAHNRWDTARQRFGRALQISEFMVEKYGESTENLSLLARALDRLGSLEAEHTQVEPALGRFVRLSEVCELIAKKSGESVENSRDFAYSLFRIGQLMLAQGRIDEGFKQLYRSLEVGGQALERHGESPHLLGSLIMSHRALAQAFFVEKQIKETQEHAQHALALASRLTSKEGFSALCEQEVRTCTELLEFCSRTS